MVLLVSLAITSLVFPECRRRLGLTKSLLGYLCLAAVPLFGVIVLRSAARSTWNKTAAVGGLLCGSAFLEW